jgi:3-oxoacyl-[acyl-carrier protein] reductase
MSARNDLLDLKGRVGLVTGAGQGVGRRIALHFAEHGAGAVVVNDFVADRAQQVAEEVRALGVRALPYRADITNADEVQAMFSAAAAELGGVDVLVNNAGNSGTSDVYELRAIPFWEQGPEHWDPWVRVNFYGVLNCCRAAIPAMIQRRYGRIVNVISDAARTGEITLEVYSGAKAAAGGFTRAIAKSLGRYEITANCVSLATIKTPTLEKRIADPETRKKMLSHYVIRRLGEPEDPANVVLFLASDAASWITGQTYAVNGGYSFAP